MLFAQAHSLTEAIVGSLVFGLIGIVLLLVGYFVFDLVLRKVNVQDELNKGNIAVAIVTGAFLIAIAIIVSHVVS
jgi:putative membrane protein